MAKDDLILLCCCLAVEITAVIVSGFLPCCLHSSPSESLYSSDGSTKNQGMNVMGALNKITQ